MGKTLFERIYLMPLVAFGGYCAGVESYLSAAFCAAGVVVCMVIESWPTQNEKADA